MRIHIIGLGVVGKATFNVLIRLGHQVTGNDKGEPIEFSPIYMICTPENVVEDIIEGIKNPSATIIIRSSVLPGTVKRLFDSRLHEDLIFFHNPEFLKESSAFYDLYFSKFVLIGRPHEELDVSIVSRIWEPLHIPIYVADSTSTELMKILTNTYAATLISFWNEVNEICSLVGINSDLVARLCTLDSRVSTYGTITGNAFGGKCLPKDLRHYIEFCLREGYTPELALSVEEINKRFSEMKGLVRG